MLKNPSLDQRFFQYHKDNPRVAKLFLKFTREAKASGRHHYSIDAIMHQVRWHIDITTKDPDGFKMNNNYTSRYARLLVKENPDLDGFFRVRRLQSETVL